jgi:hypothetical protein
VIIHGQDYKELFHTLALASILLIIICRYAKKAFCYIDVYRKGLTEKAAKFAVKKYHSYYWVPDLILQSVNI